MKKQTKKLTLAKETLRKLDSSAMKGVAGGVTRACTETGTYSALCTESFSACDSRNTCGSAYC